MAAARLHEYSVDEGVGFSKPVEIGNFSTDGENEFVPDDHQKKFLSKPDRLFALHVDLNEGFEDAVLRGTEQKRSMDFLLKWILLNKEKVNRQLRESNATTKFVSLRGTLCTIATCEQNSNDFLICATKYKGVIYMTTFDTELYKKAKTNLTEKRLRIYYWRCKFRQIITSEQSNNLPEVNENESYFVVLKTRLNQHFLMYSSVIDAADPEALGSDTNGYVSSNQYGIRGPRWELKFVNKKNLMNNWCQNYLTGTSRTVFGITNYKGVLKDILTCETSELNAVAQTQWSPDDLLKTCNDFLSFVDKTVVEDNHRVVYSFYREQDGETITCSEMRTPSEYKVLPEWYTSDF